MKKNIIIVMLAVVSVSFALCANHYYWVADREWSAHLETRDRAERAEQNYADAVESLDKTFDIIEYYKKMEKFEAAQKRLEEIIASEENTEQ